ncbi:GroES-like protein [Laetiporus sulphureus 93-53]|uniref:GroES-like protein n=1 Tax=Laetiporus sulphureus 93-53 TaxID=1314785 RepID=A0A165H1P8_9APHY|nr:GroES-like protein [Laetiporus sulphureus 93-53]KZT11120.1 GroES-like protein [Laetiporus sulphureus 93-53]
MSTGLEFKGYAMTDPDQYSALSLISYQPKTFQEDDVEIAITHCGVCGSDVHTLSQGWGNSRLPLVVGHEIIGKVTRVGSKVKDFKVGDRAGVGAQIGSCMDCKRCKTDNENYCLKMIDTYNDVYPDGVIAQGGYSTGIRAHQRFVFKIPDAIESRHAASMFCAGLTVYSPLKYNGCGPGKKVGVLGIGGLGHYAVLFAKAMGAEVYAFTHSESKLEDAKKMGADHVISTHNDDFHKPLEGELDILISTADVFREDRPFKSYLSMLFVHGKFINVGLPNRDNPLPRMHAFDLQPNGVFIGGSHIGNKLECQEMLELAAEKGIKPWIEELPMSQAKAAIEGVKSGKVRYRYVLTQDIAPVS